MEVLHLRLKQTPTKLAPTFRTIPKNTITSNNNDLILILDKHKLQVHQEFHFNRYLERQNPHLNPMYISPFQHFDTIFHFNRPYQEK